MEMSIFTRVLTRFTLGGGLGVIIGILCFQLINGMINASVSNIIGYGCGAIANLTVQWKMRDYHIVKS